MGFFDRAKRPTTTGTDYLPASVDTAVTRAQEVGTTIANRAGAVYRQNPKMIKTIASGALLIAAAAFAKKKGYM